MTSRLAASVAAVAREKAHLETILEQIGAGVVVLDSDLTVERINSAVRGLLPWLAGPSGGASLVGGPLDAVARRAMETGIPVRETLRRSDERRTWQVSAASLGDRCPGSSGVVIVLEETTELLERQRLLTWAEFAKEAAHEIKNPLTPIKLSAQHLRRAFEDQAPNFAEVLARATEMIERQAGRMEVILRELSSFTRATGRSLHPVDLCAIVTQVVQDYSFYQSRGVTIRMVCGERPVEILGDAEALRMVCGNIIDNAAKAVESGGSVTVSVESSGDMAVILCDDTGPGIPLDLVERVFEPGFSLRPGGTGLGLSICRSLVAAHGGSIHLANLDHGTRVEVRLPRLMSDGTTDSR
jgi:two-component system nitrogen regulation sensor histidine kinase NtrY